MEKRAAIYDKKTNEVINVIVIDDEKPAFICENKDHIVKVEEKADIGDKYNPVSKQIEKLAAGDLIK